MPRPRKLNVIRDKSGKSRGEPGGIHPETLAVRERELEADGVVLFFNSYVAGRGQVMRRTAETQLAGTTLGRLYLRHLQDKSDPSSISEEQKNAGEEWARVVRRHAMIMGWSRHLKSPSFMMIGNGMSVGGADPDEEEILRIRRRFSDCYNMLMDVCETNGRDMRYRDVAYGVCVEDWHLSMLSTDDCGKLRISLNVLGRALDFGKKSSHGEMR